VLFRLKLPLLFAASRMGEIGARERASDGSVLAAGDQGMVDGWSGTSGGSSEQLAQPDMTSSEQGEEEEEEASAGFDEKSCEWREEKREAIVCPAGPLQGGQSCAESVQVGRAKRAAYVETSLDDLSYSESSSDSYQDPDDCLPPASFEGCVAKLNSEIKN